MKRWLGVFVIVAFLFALCMFVNIFIITLPDWLIRASGITTLGCIAVLTYTVIKGKFLEVK
jgi:hypothetical protein